MMDLQNVSAGYGELQILYDVSLNVQLGEIVALVGANGAGKSTLINTITGMLPISSGQILFDDIPMGNERRKQLAGTFSGGEQQMLTIGRALMTRPKFLILDEPSLGLAPMIVNEVFDVIQLLLKEGVTIFLVEQNVRRCLEIANRAYVLEHGRIVMGGKSKELLEDEKVKKAYLGI
jgi:branched-chain amino acid transport system ATP-binding protein